MRIQMAHVAWVDRVEAHGAGLACRATLLGLYGEAVGRYCKACSWEGRGTSSSPDHRKGSECGLGCHFAFRSHYW